MKMKTKGKIILHSTIFTIDYLNIARLCADLMAATIGAPRPGHRLLRAHEDHAGREAVG